MGCCPVCGCKTDDLDFVTKKIGEKEEKICSFCQRQLNGFSEGSIPTEAQIRWLNAVISKEVDRPESILAFLEGLNKSVAPQQNDSSVPQGFAFSEGASSVPQGFASARVQKNAPAVNVEASALAIEELKQRIAALENELISMKRKQMIKTIIELGVPVVLAIIIVIIFFSSGLFDALQSFTEIFETGLM